MRWLQRGGGPTRRLGVSIRSWAVYKYGDLYWCFRYLGDQHEHRIFWEVNTKLIGIPGCLEPEYETMQSGAHLEYATVGDAEAAWCDLQDDPAAFMMEIML